MFRINVIDSEPNVFENQGISFELLAVGCWPLALLSRKEVFQPHLPVRLPCYDLAPVIGLTLNSVLQQLPSGPPNFHRLTGGVYKVRERIHRAIADARLLAIPTSCRRVAACNPN